MYKINCTDSKGQPAPHSVIWAHTGSAQALADGLDCNPHPLSLLPWVVPSG